MPLGSFFFLIARIVQMRNIFFYGMCFFVCMRILFKISFISVYF